MKLSISDAQKYKLVSLKAKDLPKAISVTKSPSGLYYCAKLQGRVIYQDERKWQVMGWLQDNPLILQKAKALSNQ